MLERLTTQLQQDRSAVREPHARWALVMLLAMALTGWAVYQGVTKEVHAQTGGSTATIVWQQPVSGEALVMGSDYFFRWTATPAIASLNLLMTAYLTYELPSRGISEQIILASNVPVSQGYFSRQIPTDSKLLGATNIRVTGNFTYPDGRPYLDLEHILPAPPIDVTLVQVTNPITLTAPAEFTVVPMGSTVTLRWTNHLPTGWVASLQFTSAGTSVPIHERVSLTSGSFSWRAPTDDGTGYSGRMANQEVTLRFSNFRKLDSEGQVISQLSGQTVSRRVVFDARVDEVITPASNTVTAGRPYTFHWVYPSYYSWTPRPTSLIRLYLVSPDDATLTPLSSGQVHEANLNQTTWLTTIPSELASQTVKLRLRWFYYGVNSTFRDFDSELFNVLGVGNTLGVSFSEPTGQTVGVTGQTLPIRWSLVANGWDLDTLGSTLVLRYATVAGQELGSVANLPLTATEYLDWTVPDDLAGTRITITLEITKSTTYPRSTHASDPFGVLAGGHLDNGTDPEDYFAYYVSVKQPLFPAGETNSQLTDIVTVGANESRPEGTDIHYWVILYNESGDELARLQTTRVGNALVIDKTGLEAVKASALQVGIAVAFDITKPLTIATLPRVSQFTVNYSTTFANVPFQVTITPATRTVDADPETFAEYAVNVVAVGSPIFTGSVTLTVANASWIAGSVASIFTPATITVPGSATLRLTSTTPGTYTFAVSATDAANATMVAVSDSATLIVEAVESPANVPTVVLNFTAPAQRGTIKNPALPFTLSLYDALELVKSFATTTDAGDQGTVTIPAIGSPLVLNKTYSAYVKTPQHLSKKANQDITITQPAGGNTLTVALTFPELPAGDIIVSPSTWDKVDSTDWSQFLQELAGTLLTKLADFTNDGLVDTLDAFPFVGGYSHYFAEGALRAGGIQPPTQ